MVTLSLRARVLLVVAGVNAAFFALASVFLRDRFAAENERVVESLVGQMDGVGSAVSANIRPQGELNVARILEWPGWQLAGDAILVDANLDVLPDGRTVPRGIDLNPLGAAMRGADFDRQRVLAALRRAMEEGYPVDVADGRAVPIRVPGGGEEEVWGGSWVRIDSTLDTGALFGSVLTLFLLSTLLLTIGTFGVLRWLVLEPVTQLAHGASRVQAGDFDLRLPEPRRRDEVAQLVRLFNAMTETVGTFNQRLADEVTKATAQARRAEAEAMTQRRLAAMGELAAGIAHEINNPLGGLSNAVERLSSGALPPDKERQYLGLLRSGLDRIGSTVGRLLRFTPRHSSAGPVPWVEVARDSLDLVRHRAEREGVALSLVVRGRPVGSAGGAPELPRPRGERHELGQALLNLLVNSLDALQESPPTGERPAVAVELDADGDVLTVAVADNGPGIPAEDHGRVVDLFYTTKEVGRGSGLGLSIVHSVVSSHGGRLRFSAREPRGLRVELELPGR